MDHTARMGISEGVTDLADNATRLRQRDSLIARDVGKCFAHNERHNNVWIPLWLAVIKDWKDM